MNRFLGFLTASMIGLTGSALASDISDLAGYWRTVRHGADVKITDCGDGSPCGFLSAVSDDIRDGHTHDVRNKDPQLRDRPLDGLPILWGFSRDNSSWKKGRLYNPETGQTFRSSLDLISLDELRVKGCLGPFCRSQTWIRIRQTDPHKKQSRRK